MLRLLLDSVRDGDLSGILPDLPAFGQLAAHSAEAASALGNFSALKTHLTEARLETGTGEWSLLAYACSTPVFELTPRHSAGVDTCVALLLDAGADPNATVTCRATQFGSSLTLATLAVLRGNTPVGLRLRRHCNPRPPTPDWLGGAESVPHAEWEPVIRQYLSERTNFSSRSSDLAPVGRPRQNKASGNFQSTALFRLPSVESAWAVSGSPSRVRYSGWERDSLCRTVAVVPADLTERLLQFGVDPNSINTRGISLMVAATRAGNEATVSVLRRFGARDGDVRPADSFLGACVRGDEMAAREIGKREPFLVGGLADEDHEVLLLATLHRRLGPLKLMLELGFDATRHGLSGATALHLAAWNNDMKACTLLLSHGARSNAEDKTYGESPLDWAQFSNSIGPSTSHDGVVTALTT